MSRSFGVLRSLAAAMLMAPLPIPAAVEAGEQAPAVSRFNSKLSVEGGKFDEDGIGVVSGSVTTPLGHSWGFQADGDLGIIDRETFRGGAFHLFTRDPSRYQVGLFGSFHEWNAIEVGRLAAEVELYKGQWMFSGIAGWESINVPATFNGLAVTNRDDDHFFTELDLSWYPKDNLRIVGGYHYESEENLFSGSLEYMPRWESTPASLYSHFDFGDEGHKRITGGVRFYLNGGERKSLIRRHREDDPQAYTPIFPTINTTAGVETTQNFCPLGTFNASLTPCVCPPGTEAAGGDPFTDGKTLRNCNDVFD